MHNKWIFSQQENETRTDNTFTTANNRPRHPTGLTPDKVVALGNIITLYTTFYRIAVGGDQEQSTSYTPTSFTLAVCGQSIGA